jgi:hypothetical protein
MESDMAYIATPKGPFATSRVVHSSPLQRISDVFSNNDLCVVIVFACVGLLVSLLLLKTAPFSNEVATFLSQVS